MSMLKPVWRVLAFTLVVSACAQFGSWSAVAGQAIAPLGGLKLPLPIPADAFGLEYNPDTGHLAYTSQSDFKDLTAFYRDKLKADGWEEKEPLVETDNQETLRFDKGEGSVILNITTSGKGSDFITSGEVLAHQGDAIKPMPVAASTLPGATAGAAAPDASEKTAAATASPDAAKPPLPMPDDATDVQYEADAGSLQFNSAKSVKDLSEFYRSLAKTMGLAEQAAVINKENMAVLTFMKGEKMLNVTVMMMGNKAMVTADGSLLEGKTTEQADAAAAAPPLVAIDKDGLPIPDGLGNMGATRTQFSHAVNFSASNSVPDIVAFYRAELAKKNWKEDSAKVSNDAADLKFTAPDGPATLSLKRNGDMTDAELTVTEKAKAAASPLAPKPGMVKLVFGNMSDNPADVVVAGKHVKMTPGQGAKAPDGPTLEVKPGNITVVSKNAKESFTAGPDEIWMVAVGPGGLMVVKQ